MGLSYNRVVVLDLGHLTGKELSIFQSKQYQLTSYTSGYIRAHLLEWMESIGFTRITKVTGKFNKNKSSMSNQRVWFDSLKRIKDNVIDQSRVTCATCKRQHLRGTVSWQTRLVTILGIVFFIPLTFRKHQ